MAKVSLAIATLYAHEIICLNNYVQSVFIKHTSIKKDWNMEFNSELRQKFRFKKIKK